MFYEMGWAIFGTVFLLALAGLALIAGHLRASRKLQLRMIQKEERMKALEAGIPLPEVEDASLHPPGSREAHAYQVKWLRLVSLAVGCFMVFSGIGMLFAFGLSDDSGLSEMTSIGLLPALAGVGLLFFYWLTRHTGNGDSDP